MQRAKQATATGTSGARPDFTWPTDTAIVVLTLAVFAVDWVTPLGYAVWLIYLVPLLLTASTRRPGRPLVLAAVCSLLLWIGFMVSPAGIGLSLAIFNRTIGVLVLWLVAIILRRRTLAEAALRETHDRLEKTTATTPGIVCSFKLRPDGSACFAFGGERLAEHFGVAKGILAEDAAPFFALVHPDDLARLKETTAESASCLTPFRHEWRMRHLARGELWIETHSVPKRESDGSTLWHGVATDVTERKRTEVALRAQHTELENLYATTPVGLALIDRALRFVRINERLAAINGMPVEAHLGRTVEDVLPELAPVLVPLYRRVLGGEPILDVEIHGTTSAEPDIQRDWLASYHPLRAADGSVSGISVAVTEITRQKRAEAALREHQRQLSEAQRIARIGSWSYDASGRHSWSDEMYRIYGVAPDTFAPDVESFIGLIHPDDRPAMQAWIASCVAGDNAGELEFRAIRPDGMVRFIRSRAELERAANGGPTNFTGTAQDVTDRVMARQELEASHKNLRQFAANLITAREEEGARIAREIHDQCGQMLTGLKMDAVWLARHLSDPETTLQERVAAMSKLIDETVQTVRLISTELRPGVLDDLGLAAAVEWQAEQFTKRTGIPCEVRARVRESELGPQVPITVSHSPGKPDERGSPCRSHGGQGDARRGRRQSRL